MFRNQFSSWLIFSFVFVFVGLPILGVDYCFFTTIQFPTVQYGIQVSKDTVPHKLKMENDLWQSVELFQIYLILHANLKMKKVESKKKMQI